MAKRKFTFRKLHKGSIVITKNKEVHLAVTEDEEKELYLLLRNRDFERRGWSNNAQHYEQTDARKG